MSANTDHPNSNPNANSSAPSQPDRIRTGFGAPRPVGQAPEPARDQQSETIAGADMPGPAGGALRFEELEPPIRPDTAPPSSEAPPTDRDS